MTRLPTAISALASILLATTAFGSSTPLLQIPQEDWQPRMGDRLFVDTKNTIGYLIHTDGRYTTFPVVTGQNRYVSYIGRYYKATTPTWDWSVKSTHIEGDRVTFGETGRFLRLYKDGERTAYGIHGHRDAETMLSEDKRFRSMGCIIISEEVLSIIEQTYNLGGGTLNVTTEYGSPFAVLLSAEEKDTKTD